MLSLAHTIISLPFGLLPIPSSVILLLAFLFHFVLDGLLHWNIYPPRHRRFPFVLVSLDIILGLLISFFLMGNQFFSWPIFAAIIGANLPDILQSLWSFAGEPAKHYWRFVYPFFRLHNQIQWETTNIPLGLISQILLIGIVITMLR